MKRLIILCLVIFLILGLTITSIAKINLNYATHTSIAVEGLEPGEYEQKLIDEFEALYPDIHIDLEVIPYAGDQGKIEMSIATGNPPDILSADIQKLKLYQSAGLLVDFDDVINKSNFYDFAVEACSVDGKMYYYPMGLRPGSFMVSKSMAEKLGVLDLVPLEVERIWTTENFEKFIAKVNEISEKGVYAFCLNFADTAAWGHQLMHFTGFGGEIFTVEDGKYKCIANNPEMAEGLQFYVDLIEKYPNAIPGGAENVTIVDLDNLWTSGNLICCPGSVNQVIKEREGSNNVGFDLALMPYPAKEGVRPGVPSDWCGYMVFNTGSDIRASWAKKFVKYFVDNAPDLTGANFNTFPVQKDMSPPKAFEQYRGDVEIDYAINIITQFAKDLGDACPLMSQFKELLQIHMQGVLVGELTVKECLAKVEDKTNKLLDEYYAE